MDKENNLNSLQEPDFNRSRHEEIEELDSKSDNDSDDDSDLIKEKELEDEAIDLELQEEIFNNEF